MIATTAGDGKTAATIRTLTVMVGEMAAVIETGGADRIREVIAGEAMIVARTKMVTARDTGATAGVAMTIGGIETVIATAAGEVLGTADMATADTGMAGIAVVAARRIETAITTVSAMASTT